MEKTINMPFPFRSQHPPLHHVAHIAFADEGDEEADRASADDMRQRHTVRVGFCGTIEQKKHFVAPVPPFSFISRCPHDDYTATPSTGR